MATKRCYCRSRTVPPDCPDTSLRVEGAQVSQPACEVCRHRLQTTGRVTVLFPKRGEDTVHWYELPGNPDDNHAYWNLNLVREPSVRPRRSFRLVKNKLEE